jgi:hypothetical protein
MCSIAERFVLRTTTAAESGLGIPNRRSIVRAVEFERAVEQDWSIWSRDHPQYAPTIHVIRLLLVFRYRIISLEVDLHVAVVTEWFVLRQPAATKCHSRIPKQRFVVSRRDIDVADGIRASSRNRYRWRSISIQPTASACGAAVLIWVRSQDS